MSKTRTVAWFSAGVSSAVATKLEIDRIDDVIYIHIDDHEKDTMRFVKDCEQWFGKPIQILQSQYKSVEEAVNGSAFIKSAHGASCTRLLKKRVREEWEAEHRFFNHFRYVWGMDSTEAVRAERLRETMHEDEHLFPLIERGITKQDAHGILKAAGIARPHMYDLGYQNANCIGCWKGGMAYWNRVRVTHPEVFKARAEQERRIGHHGLKECFLDELDPERGRDKPPIVEECGAMCEMNLEDVK